MPGFMVRSLQLVQLRGRGRLAEGSVPASHRRRIIGPHFGGRMTVATDSTRRNGVDTATLFATLDAVKAQPEIAKFRFRATNAWSSGPHSRSSLSGFFGAQQEMAHKQITELDSDHPAVLVGNDNGTTPRWSTCCMRSRRALPPALPTSPRRAMLI